MGINPININVYWVLNGYPIRPNYDPSIISTNHPTLKYFKTTKFTKNTLETSKITKISPKPNDITTLKT